jgi:ATP-dependent helicase/nuclease subunit A
MSDQAQREQLAASDPRVSAFVAASAGSGKTKLLTDRLLRLFLAGTAPGKILCLTYTKAAAAEMAIRLNRRLGAWVVMGEADLAAQLWALDVVPNADNMARARKIFGEVLDLPGGVKISTIHAFCQSLLRRFPLEAGLSPHFELADDSEANLLLREARELVLAESGQRDAIHTLAAQVDEQGFAALVQKFAAEAPEFLDRLQKEGSGALAATQAATLGAEDDGAKILYQAVTWRAEQPVRAAWAAIAANGPPTAVKRAQAQLAWLSLPPVQRAMRWNDWVGGLFGENPYKMSYVMGAKLDNAQPWIGEALGREQIRILAVNDARKCAELAALNASLLNILAPILAKNGEEKALAARLGYSDLVMKTSQLLVDPGAAWVLYKLDGGIDHLLLDEVQDTAPEQWAIAGAIADEFFAGVGAREAARTIFAVGDEKQSIFSFQGADLASFDDNRSKFREKAVGAAQKFLDGRLSVSFRSTAPVLALVDAVFADGLARDGVVDEGESLVHGVSRAGQAGRVTLWPLTEAVEPDPVPAWAVPEGYKSGESAKTVLARQIAAHIKAELDTGRILPSRGTAVRAGDFLILVRRRDALFTAITAALKGSKIPVAGLDRMVLAAQPAVSDLLALCDALILPQDDLAFGQFLVSPLGGLSDESFMQLALGRKRRLVEVLFARAEEQDDWRQARDFYAALAAKTDFLTPHNLLAFALGPLGGRAKLLARLGEEAAEPIDELLSEALNAVTRGPPSMQHFLAGLRAQSGSIKREADAGGDMARIMTVHGAKGLQAPIVILPDTTQPPRFNETLFWVDGVPLYCPRTELRPRLLDDAAAAAAGADSQEYNRLLYVALTRAEDEILVAGAKGAKEPLEGSWYESVRAGFLRMGAEERDGALVYESPQDAAPDRQAPFREVTGSVLPLWAGAAPDWQATPPAAETTRPERLAPSRSVEGEQKRALAASPLGEDFAKLRAGRAHAMEKGRVVHALLQHLPGHADPEAAGRRYLATLPALADQTEEILAAVLAVLRAPALAPLFGPGSRAEIPLAGVVKGVEIGGLVDRLAVTDTEILIADYKTDRMPPADAEGIPEAYLRQLAAYKTVLAEIYPNHGVKCLLVWTATAAIMPVPHAALARYAPA